jgi:hypothetical protein
MKTNQPSSVLEIGRYLAMAGGLLAGGLVAAPAAAAGVRVS